MPLPSRLAVVRVTRRRVAKTLEAALIIAVVAMLAWLLSTPLRDWWSMHSMVDAARQRPFVSDAYVIEGDSVTEIDIELAPEADDADARHIYCELVIPSGWVHQTTVSRGNDYWIEPADCSDPADVPAVVSG